MKLTAEQRIQIAVAATVIDQCLLWSDTHHFRPADLTVETTRMRQDAISIAVAMERGFYKNIPEWVRSIGETPASIFNSRTDLYSVMAAVLTMENVLGLDHCRRNSGLPSDASKQIDELMRRCQAEFYHHRSAEESHSVPTDII